MSEPTDNWYTPWHSTCPGCGSVKPEVRHKVLLLGHMWYCPNPWHDGSLNTTPSVGVTLDYSDNPNFHPVPTTDDVAEALEVVSFYRPENDKQGAWGGRFDEALATTEAAYREAQERIALADEHIHLQETELTALRKGYGDLPKLRQQRDDYGDALAKAEARLAALHVVLRAVAEATYLVRLAKDAHAWGRISFDELCIYEDDAVSILDAWKAGQR